MTLPKSPPPQFDLARAMFAILAILGLGLLSLWVMSPFFVSIVWATMIVVACWPLMLRLQALLHGRRALAVTAMVLLMLAVFIVPVLLAVDTLIDNAGTLVRWTRLAATFEVPPAPNWVGQLPLVGSRAAELWNGLHDTGLGSLVQRAAPYAGKGAQWLAGQAGNIGLLLLHFFLTVVIAAVLFAQGEGGARRAMQLAQRIGGARGEEILRLAAAAIRGVAISVVGTALVQTLIAGIGLSAAGVPFAGFLTAAALILCIAQLGPGLVLVPAVIWLYVDGQTGWGTFLLVFSVLAMTVDNIVRPILVRFGADLPLLLIFAGVIGGMATLGVVGVFIGPVVLAVTWRLLEAWADDAPADAGAAASASDQAATAAASAEGGASMTGASTSAAQAPPAACADEPEAAAARRQAEPPPA